ncbi:uncharacterized protein BDZ99DRAFT_17026 [Mytilinidion resinicola]|uniref:Uncharacterized protein n=1 Tax=Mytilinidion resinicola TaxID=574789 RepID=A0A6A6Z9W8_9PEZI|nr:uncharacterized protein BDZ99DRAFT_17026 [Mytilinidion resinicola]KAF2817489.1 hypothetical protein BDZ99DRAFT_17026 [Mytilinidion resinicola]
MIDDVIHFTIWNFGHGGRRKLAGSDCLRRASGPVRLDLSLITFRVYYHLCMETVGYCIIIQWIFELLRYYYYLHFVYLTQKGTMPSSAISAPSA